MPEVPHKSCNGPTERGLCLWHLTFADHCQRCQEQWPCEVVRLRRQGRDQAEQPARPDTTEEARGR